MSKQMIRGMGNWLLDRITDSRKWHPDSGITEEHTFNGKAIKVKKIPLDRPLYLCPDDEFHLTVQMEDGGIQKREFPITQAMRADEAFIFEMDDALGYKHCLIGGFGQVGD